jgi:hypothetical protein
MGALSCQNKAELCPLECGGLLISSDVKNPCHVSTYKWICIKNFCTLEWELLSKFQAFLNTHPNFHCKTSKEISKQSKITQIYYFSLCKSLEHKWDRFGLRSKDKGCFCASCQFLTYNNLLCAFSNYCF